MNAAVIPPDVEGLVCGWLPAQMTAHGFTLPVGTRVPNPRPAEFLRVLATGGDRYSVVQERPTLIVEAWAGTETRASLLARTARALLGAMAGQVIAGTTVYRGRDFTLPVNLPDPTSAQIRYTFSGQLWLRNTAV